MSPLVDSSDDREEDILGGELDCLQAVEKNTVDTLAETDLKTLIEEQGEDTAEETGTQEHEDETCDKENQTKVDTCTQLCH